MCTFPDSLGRWRRHYSRAGHNAAGLSFLTLGVQPPTPEWGVMISEGGPYIVSGHWRMSFFPGATLMLMTAGFILIGDGIDARSKR